jgi:hypothetical protein
MFRLGFAAKKRAAKRAKMHEHMAYTYNVFYRTAHRFPKIGGVGGCKLSYRGYRGYGGGPYIHGPC